MSSVVIASVPVTGHVTPLLAVAEGLVEHGHDVRFLTGRRFAEAVARTGATHVTLPSELDYDDRTHDPLDSCSPRPRGIEAERVIIDRMFLEPARGQLEALRTLADSPDEVVLADSAFVGAELMAGAPRRERPAVVGLGVVPLSLASKHVPPFGLGLRPLRGPANLLRNAVLSTLMDQVVLRPQQRRYDALWTEAVGRRSGTSLLNGVSAMDAVVQLSVPSFEFPCPDATVPVHFAGPLGRRDRGLSDLPEWWPDVVSGPPVVHVTQGTLDNRDLSELVVPTMQALAGEDVLVVATTGGPSPEVLGPLPANARAAPFLPYDQLLPHVDVVVTNGGYGGVQQALKHGIPVVVAGRASDKPDVAARVTWSGTGVDLHRSDPSRQRIRQAVRRLLRDPRYRARAAAVATEMAEAGGITTVLRAIEAARSQG